MNSASYVDSWLWISEQDSDRVALTLSLIERSVNDAIHRANVVP